MQLRDMSVHMDDLLVKQVADDEGDIVVLLGGTVPHEETMVAPYVGAKPIADVLHERLAVFFGFRRSLRTPSLAVAVCVALVVRLGHRVLGFWDSGIASLAAGVPSHTPWLGIGSDIASLATGARASRLWSLGYLRLPHPVPRSGVHDMRMPPCAVS